MGSTLTPDSFMASLSSGPKPPASAPDELTPDSFMAGLKSASPAQASPPPLPAPVQKTVHPLLADLPQPHDAAAQADLNAQQVLDRLESVGRQMQSDALSKIPHELRGFTPQESAQPSGQFNPRTGQQYTVGQQNERIPLFDGPITGAPTIAQGVEQMASPGLPSKAGGAAKILEGGMDVASPLVIPAAVVNPLATAGALTAGTAATEGTKAGLKKLGVPDQYADLAGDVAGLGAGALGAHGASKLGPKTAVNPDAALPAERTGLDHQVEPAPSGSTASRTTVDLTPDQFMAEQATATPENSPAAEKLTQDQQLTQDSRGGTNPKLTPDEFMAQQETKAPSAKASAAETPTSKNETLTPDSFMAAQGDNVPDKSASNPVEKPGTTPATEQIGKDISNDNRNDIPLGQSEEPQGQTEQNVASAQEVGGDQEAAQSVAPRAVDGGERGAVAPGQEEAPVSAREPETPPAYGHAVAINVPGESTVYPARYSVRELSGVEPSHNPFSFERNPNYEFENDRDYSNPQNAARVVEYAANGNYKPDYPLTPSPTAEQGPPIIDQRGNVLGGNNRTMTAARVYENNPAGANAYRSQLAQNAQQYGIDPRELMRFERPVLTRELQQPLGTGAAQRAITDFNKTASAKLSPEEQAVTDGRRLSPATVQNLAANLGDVGENSTLAQALKGDKGADILQSLVKDGMLTPQEQNAYLDERGQLTGDAKNRIAKALVGRLFESSVDYARTPPELRNKLERVAPQVLRVEGRPEWSLTKPVREAVSALADARAHGLKNVDDLARQTDLNGNTKSYSPEALAIAKTLNQGPVNAARAFRQYAADADMSRDGSPMSIFEPPTRQEAFASSFGERQPVQFEASMDRSLFDPAENEDVANTAARDRARLERERLTAQMRAPLTREEQVKKLKLSKEKPQTSLFEDNEGPPQQSLFGGRTLKPEYNRNNIQFPSFKDEPRYTNNTPDVFHGRQSRIEPIQLPAGDAARANAFLANRSLVELISRWSDRPQDSGSEHIGALHLSPDQADALAENAGVLLKEYAGKKPEALAQLMEAAQASAASGKSLVIANSASHNKAPALQEELDHALQNSIQPKHGLTDHLGVSAGSMLGEGSVGARAADNLAWSLGYKFRSSGHKASEIGVRLMEPGRYREMGIDAAEADQLGQQYVKLLGKEYGDANVREIRERIESLNRGNQSEEESRRSRLLQQTDGVRADAGTPAERDAATLPGDHGQSPADHRSGPSGPQKGPLDFEESLTKQQPEDEGKVNYSGLGAVQDKFVRNLSQLEKASEPAHLAAIRAATSKSQAAVILKTAMPQIEKALGGDVSPIDFRRALIQSRLEGIRERWSGMADFAQRASEANLQKSLENVLPVLENLEDRAGLPRNLGDTAGSLAEKKDFASLRGLLSDSFGQAAEHVATVMPKDEFDRARFSPGFQKALGVYKDLVEKPMATNHALNEGVFSNALGPLNTYYPLVPVTEEDAVRAQVGSRLAYSKPKNIANHMATGLAQEYDANMDALRDRLTQAVRTNNKAALMNSLEEEGLVKALKPFESAGQAITYAGQEFQAVKMETSPARQIIQGGKSTFVPPSAVMVPKWLAHELAPILDRGERPTPGAVQKIIAAANTVAISGPADFVYHTANLTGTLVANTPFLGNSLLDKAGSLPVLKRFTAIGKVLAVDPTTEEAAGDLQEMAKLGILPDRFGSETYSKKYAEQTGAALKRFSSGPMLYGPKGIDIRARLVMYRIAKEINPGASGPQLHMFVNQLGTYNDALQSQIVRSAKRSGLAPFATAGTSMIRNGINAWLGTGPMPKSGIGMHVWQQLTGGGVGLVAVWALAYKAYSGKYPWQDKRAKLLQIPANPEDRNSKLGRMLWGKGADTGYINFTMFNPLVGRGERALGIKGAVDNAAEGGKWFQQLEAAEKDMLNTYAHPFLGPVPKAAFVGLTDREPYVTGLRDDRAKPAPQFFPLHGNRVANAAKELNNFYGNVSAASGLGQRDPHDTTNHWVRMIFDLAMPGLVGQAQNPYRQRANVLRQAAMEKRNEALEKRQAR